MPRRGGADTGFQTGSHLVSENVGFKMFQVLSRLEHLVIPPKRWTKKDINMVPK